VAIPTGIPLIYKFDRNLSPLRQNTDEPRKESPKVVLGGGTLDGAPQTAAKATSTSKDGSEERAGFTVMQAVVRGAFLEEKGVLWRALAQEKEWASLVPDYEEVMSSDRRLSGMTPYLRSLSKLEAERQLKVYTQQVRRGPHV
jgi:hypothetical protein